MPSYVFLKLLMVYMTIYIIIPVYYHYIKLYRIISFISDDFCNLFILPSTEHPRFPGLFEALQAFTSQRERREIRQDVLKCEALGGHFANQNMRFHWGCCLSLENHHFQWEKLC